MGIDNLKDYAKALASDLEILPYESIYELAQMLERARENGNAVFTMGNGGSSSAASHLVNDLVKGSPSADGRCFRAFCLSDNVPLLTAFSNDDSYEVCFQRQIEAFVQPGDVVIGITGSGNSPNILAAFKAAAQRGAKTVGLLGYGGGKAAAVVDLAVIFESRNMQRVEDLHVIVGHMLMTYFMALRVSKLS